jgi:hypothetical protein
MGRNRQTDRQTKRQKRETIDFDGGFDRESIGAT